MTPDDPRKPNNSRKEDIGKEDIAQKDVRNEDIGPGDIRKLVGGYATGILTEAERKFLFEAALLDQDLFDELAREQVLKDALEEPGTRERLIAALDAAEARGGLASWFRTGGLVWGAAAAVAAAIAVAVWLPLRQPPPREVAVLSERADFPVRPPVAEAPLVSPNEPPSVSRNESASRDSAVQPNGVAQANRDAQANVPNQGVPNQKETKPEFRDQTAQAPSESRNVTPSLARAPAEALSAADALKEEAAAKTTAGPTSTTAVPQGSAGVSGGSARKSGGPAGVSGGSAPVVRAQRAAVPLSTQQAPAAPLSDDQVSKATSGVSTTPPAPAAFSARVAERASTQPRFAFDYALGADGRLTITARGDGYLRVTATVQGANPITVFPASAVGAVTAGAITTNSAATMSIPPRTTEVEIVFSRVANTAATGAVAQDRVQAVPNSNALSGTVEDSNPSPNSRVSITLRVPPRP